jgi:hypothetical protein
MSENRQANPDPLEAAICAFTNIRVPERPPDEQVLARLGTGRSLRRWLLPSAVAAGLLLVGLVLFMLKSKQPEFVQATAPSSPATAREVAIQSKSTVKRTLGERSMERLRERPLSQRVAEAQVIVVATALDSAPAPVKKPGDLQENLLRFKVLRVLKGNPPAGVITTQTPTAAAEFIGKDWIVMLSPDYMAGKYRYAGCLAVQFESTVKAILAKAKK